MHRLGVYALTPETILGFIAEAQSKGEKRSHDYLLCNHQKILVEGEQPNNFGNFFNDIYDTFLHATGENFHTTYPLPPSRWASCSGDLKQRLKPPRLSI